MANEGLTPEGAAMRLLAIIANAEKKLLDGYPSGDWTAPERKWVLETYAECLRIVKQSS